MKKSIVLSFAAALLLAGCGAKPQEKIAPAPAAPAAKAEPQKTVSAPGEIALPPKTDALVTFISGDVETLRGGKWEPVEIGDNLPQDAVVRVKEQAFCEIQFGGTAVIRVNEKTEISLDRVAVESGSSKVAVGLNSGTVLAKVNKLGTKDKFQVRTKGAVCGVRGTEFAVSMGSDGVTRLKVKKGAVAILPAAADVERVAKSIGIDVAAAPLVEAAAELVAAAAPVVTVDQEIAVAPQVAAKTEAVLKTVEKEVRSLAAAPAPSGDAEKEKMLEGLKEKVAAKAVSAMAKPAVLSVSSAKELSAIGTMAILPLPETAKPGEAPDQGKKEAEPRFMVVSLSAMPEDAEILLDGAVAGRGSFKRMLAEGAKLTVTVRREGYEPQEVNLEAGAKAEYKVELVAKPRDLTIKAVPSDAEILVDGAVVGKGSFKGAYKPGTEIKVALRKEGFEEKIVPVSITMDTAPVLTIELGKVSKEISVTVEPRDAQIFVGSAAVGKGAYKALRNVGDKLAVKAVRPGYEDKSASLEVSASGENALSLTLVKIRKEVRVSVEPADAKIALNGKDAGAGAVTGTYDFGDSLVFEASKEGYASGSLKFDIDASVKPQYTIRLERARMDISVSATPQDATIFLGGKPVGTGIYRAKAAFGEKLEFTVRRDGYAEKSATLEVGASAPAELRLDLDAKAVYARFRVSSAKLVGLAVSGGRILGSDVSGTVFCAGRDGKILWTAKTANSGNESTPPVVYGGKVYFSGSKELVILDEAQGTVLAKKPLETASANLFGRRPVGTDKGILFPSDQAALLLDPLSGDTLKTLKFDGTSRMTPLYLNGRIYFADQMGKVHVLDAEGGSEVASIATQALQPLTQAIQVSGGVGYFSGRKGNLVAIDLEKNAVLWQSKIQDANAAVFFDLVCAEGTVFAFSRNAIYSFDAKTGKAVPDPLKDASAPPEAIGGVLYYGTAGGDLAYLNLGTKAAGKLPLKAKLSTRPEKFADDLIVAGTETGEVIVLNPKGF